MSDYQLKYTGQEIDNLLDKVNYMNTEVLIVTDVDAGTASHSPQEIYQAVQQGKQVFLEFDGMNTLVSCNGYNSALFISYERYFFEIDKNCIISSYEDDNAIITRSELYSTIAESLNSLPSNLIVTVDYESNTASHSAVDIENCVANGGTVFLKEKGSSYNNYRYYILRSIESVSGSLSAHFGCIDDSDLYYDLGHYIITINSAKQVSRDDVSLSYFNYRITTMYDEELDCWYADDRASIMMEHIYEGYKLYLVHKGVDYTVAAIEDDKIIFHNISEDGHVTVLTFGGPHEYYEGQIVTISEYDIDANDGAYELIETITVEESVARIDRTAEPNGTAYNFKAVFLKCTMNAGENASYFSSQMYPVGELSNADATFNFYVAGGITTTTANTIIYLFPLYGHMVGMSSNPVPNAWDAPSSWKPPVYERMGRESKPIGKVRVSGGINIPVGSIIEIWGVRTDPNSTVIPNGDEVSY